MANTIQLSTYKSFTRKRLGDDSFDDSSLTQFANDTSREICNTEPWPFMETSFTGVLTVGQPTYEFQSNCQSLINLILIDPNNNARYLHYLSFEAFDEYYPDPTSFTQSQPTVWTQFGTAFMVGPSSPNLAYTLIQRYRKDPTTLTGDANTLDVPDSFSELVVLGMLRRALMANDNYDQAQVVAQEYDIQLERMRIRLMARQTAENSMMGNGRRRINDLDPYAYYE